MWTVLYMYWLSQKKGYLCFIIFDWNVSIANANECLWMRHLIIPRFCSTFSTMFRHAVHYHWLCSHFSKKSWKKGKPFYGTPGTLNVNIYLSVDLTYHKCDTISCIVVNLGCGKSDEPPQRIQEYLKLWVFYMGALTLSNRTPKYSYL